MDENVTKALKLVGSPISLEEVETISPTLEKYAIAMYTNDASLQTVNEARQILFCGGDRPLTSVPPTKSALTKHIKRAVYQAGHLWGKADQLHQSLTSPQHWGWQKTAAGWEPYWSELPPK